MITPARIYINNDTKGYYLRWYYNGWHYWLFKAGTREVMTSGEKYRTLSKRIVELSSGVITAQQVKAIRSIMNTKEVYIYTDYGFATAAVEKGSCVVERNEVNAYELNIAVTINSRQISATGFSPVAAIPFTQLPSVTIDASWTQKLTGLNGMLFSVSMAGEIWSDTLVGWSVGRDASLNTLILKTSDGGVSWSQQTSPVSGGTLWGVSAVDSDTAFACGVDSSDVPILLRTTDGGDNWQNITPWHLSDTKLMAVDFIDENTGIAVGYETNWLSPVVLKTTNGGVNWSEQTVPINITPFGVSMVNSDVAWLVGDDGELPYIFTTNNGGATWTQQVFSTDGYLYDVKAYDVNHVYAVGERATGETLFIKTTDGETWENGALPVVYGACRSVDFCDVNNGMFVGLNDATGKLFVARTTDGGENWIEQTLPVEITDLYGVCLKSNYAVAVGYKTPVNLILLYK